MTGGRWCVVSSPLERHDDDAKMTGAHVSSTTPGPRRAHVGGTPATRYKKFQHFVKNSGQRGCHWLAATRWDGLQQRWRRSQVVARHKWMDVLLINSIYFRITLKILTLLVIYRYLVQKVKTNILTMELLKRYYADQPPTYISLEEYCRGRQVIDRFCPPGAQLVPAPQYHGIRQRGPPHSQGAIRQGGPGECPVLAKLAEPAQAIIRRLLDILNAMFLSGHALAKVHFDTFIVDKTTNCLKLSRAAQLSVVPITSSSQVDTNVAELSYVIEEFLFNANRQSIYEVHEVGKGLFKLMRSHGNSMWHVILNHCSLIPIENRSDAYGRMYDTLVYVLKQLSVEEHKKVLENLEFPIDWQDQVQENSWLLSFYCGSLYNSQELTQVTQATEITRYLRNSCAHGMERGCGHLSRSDIAKLHLTLAPMLMHTLMVGLETMGWLTSNNLDRFMVYSF